ncbi:ribosome biogenesis protein UTP30, partial [Lecanoromycetidae sp. Uapishka_2]
MAPESTALTTKVESGSRYDLDISQTLRASTALLKHIKSKSQQKEATAPTKNLLAADPTSLETNLSDAEPIWLILTTKKFMTDHQQLKPRKIALAHSFNCSANASICLITPEPQRLFKDAIVHPSFPGELSKRITKVISVKKLEAKFHSFEAKRQLRDSYDIFLADDRIVSYLAKILGKTFYKTTPKRPIPVRLEASKPKERKIAALPSEKKRKDPSVPTSIAAPNLLAKEIERTLATTQIHLHPSSTTSIKVGLASFTPEQVSANIEAVMTGLTGKLVAWRNVRAVHIKGPNTMALPVWLADELWTDEDMVLNDEQVAEVEARKKLKHVRRRMNMVEGPKKEDEGAEFGEKKRKVEYGDESDKGESKKKKIKRLADEDLSTEMKERRQKLRQQKKAAREQAEAKMAMAVGGGMELEQSVKAEK